MRCRSGPRIDVGGVTFRLRAPAARTVDVVCGEMLAMRCGEVLQPGSVHRNREG